jgi:hypothetical protein
VKSHSAKPKVEVTSGLSLATLKAMLGSESLGGQSVFTPSKDSKALYVADVRMPQQILPNVPMRQQATWKGKVWSFGGAPRGKIMCNVAFDSFQFHFKKKENLLTIKIRLYQIKYGQ